MTLEYKILKSMYNSQMLWTSISSLWQERDTVIDKYGKGADSIIKKLIATGYVYEVKWRDKWYLLLSPAGEQLVYLQEAE